ncbi:hypothetical protein [Streptomyces sp. CAU 1734]|uniref:hypothetical protein n=1 Tax=Streptomyces sp. CAU 1734 TaxID=3140360 RepID=UPI00326193E8
MTMPGEIRSGDVRYVTDEPSQDGAPEGVVITNRDPLMMEYGDDGPCMEPAEIS